MRVLLLSIALDLLLFFGVKAQAVKTYYVVNSLEVPVKVIPKNDQIRYPQFREGMVDYINGKTIIAKMNYSILYGEMHYITPEGDTLVLPQEQTIKKVIIGEDEYYSLHGQGYVEVLASYAQIKLARKQLMKIIVWGGAPAKGYSYENTYLGDKPTLEFIYNKKTQSLMKIVREVSYIFVDQNQRYYKANQSILFKLFPGQRKQIYRYAKANKINFKQAEDLIKIVEFAVNNPYKKSTHSGNPF